MDLKGRNFLTLKDFTPEEITERFARGDLSRNTEGEVPGCRRISGSRCL